MLLISYFYLAKNKNFREATKPPKRTTKREENS